MTKLFGTDGIRGTAGVFPLDVPTMRRAGASLTRHLQHELSRPPKIVSGRDTRESGEWLEGAFVEGAFAAGAECRSAGVITTPGIGFLTRHLPADAGVVISASHNEYTDNGLKIFAPTGRKINERMEGQMESDLKCQTPTIYASGAFVDQIRTDDSLSLQRHYLNFLVNDVSPGLTLAGMTVAVDCANGAGSSLARKLLEELGARVVTINCEPDGKNINRDCGSLHPERLQKVVATVSADLGLALDGDADRSLFVDEKGSLVDGDATLWALAQYLQKTKQLPGAKVVATVMSNIGLEIALRSIGVELVRTDVGDKFVLDELLGSGAGLGGEQSGHIILPQVSLAGDGMITTLMLLTAMRTENQPLSSLTRGIERYPQVLINVPVREKRDFSELPLVMESVAWVESELGENGRLLLRYSGTERLARIMIEGPNEALVKGLASEIAKTISDALGG